MLITLISRGGGAWSAMNERPPRHLMRKGYARAHVEMRPTSDLCKTHQMGPSPWPLSGTDRTDLSFTTSRTTWLSQLKHNVKMEWSLPIGHFKPQKSSLCASRSLVIIIIIVLKGQYEPRQVVLLKDVNAINEVTSIKESYKQQMLETA